MLNHVCSIQQIQVQEPTQKDMKTAKEGSAATSSVLKAQRVILRDEIVTRNITHTQGKCSKEGSQIQRMVQLSTRTRKGAPDCQGPVGHLACS